MTGSPTVPAAARRLADWSARLTLDIMPQTVRQAVGRHLLDGLGTTLAAARLNAASPAVTVARGLGGPAQATILGTGDRVGAAAAALANGAQAHALDYDDTHAGGLVHATAAVLPAALAVGEETGASGADLLVAAAAGLEAVCRLGAAAPHAFHAQGLHATAVCGVFAAALVSARLYRLDPEHTTHALGIAGSQAGGLLEFLNTGASTKQLHPGFTGQAGVIAARLAAAGATGPSSVLEGEYGLYAALVGMRVDPDALTGGLGRRWEATRITIKPYPVCQLSHAVLDAVRQLPLEGIDPADITGVAADVHPDAAQVVCAPGKAVPGTAYAAKFSLAWCVARLLVYGELTEDAFTRIEDPAVLALAARFRHRVVDFGGAAADQPGIVRVKLRDGRRLDARVPRSSGGPEDPGVGALVRTKAVGNIGAGPAAERLADRMLDLAAQPDLGPVLTGIRTATRTPDWEQPQMITPIAGAGPAAAPDLPAGTVAGRTARLAAATAPGGGAAHQAAAAFGTALAALAAAGYTVSDVVHVVEYVCPAALTDYAAVTRARRAALDGHTPAVATVAVAGLPEPGALLAIELTAYTGGGERVVVFEDSPEEQGNAAFHRGTLRVAGDVVYLPSVHPIDVDGNLVAPDDFRGQYRHCLEATGDLLAAAGLGLDSLTQTTDYTSTATRAEYPRCGRPRKELLGGTGTDGRPVHPGAAGILVDQPIVPGAGVSLDSAASRRPLRAVNPGWRRYETLTYKPAVADGSTLFMSGFGALEPATQKALFDGDLLAQAEFTYASIGAALREAGLTGSSVVRLVEYLLPEALPDYPKLAELRAKYFGYAGPALTPVVVTALLRPEFLIEVVPTAVFTADGEEAA